MRFYAHLFFFVCLISCSAAAGSPPLQAQTSPSPGAVKILHIMSYHSPWRWTDWQQEGFLEELRGLPVTMQTFQMDTKRNSSTEAKEAKGLEARQLIDSWQPDLVYTTDDDAQQFVTRHYLGSKLPFVFSGVNNDPDIYGFRGNSNIAGVLEQEHFVESVKLLKKMVPGASRIALIFDDAKMWEQVRRRIHAAMGQLPGMRIVADDAIFTFAEYQKKMGEYQQSADMVATLGIFNLKDAAGNNVPYQEVQRWTVENSMLPDFAFWIDRVHYGTLAAVTVSEREQGRAAGRLARAILQDGKKPASFPMAPTDKGLPAMNLERAKKLGVRLEAEVLLTAEVISHYDWDKP